MFKKTLLAFCISLVTPAMNVVAEDNIPAIPGLKGFTIFDAIGTESKSDPEIAIPKRWKFIGVSNGEKSNSNNLWFQDTDGSIYMIDGYTKYNQFIIKKVVHKLNAK